MAWGVWDYPEPPEEKPLPTCPVCQDDLTEPVFMVEGKAICEDCFLEYIKDFSATEFADALGFDYKSLDEWEGSA